MYTRSEINKFLRNYKCTGSQKKTAQDFADFAYVDQKDKAGGTLMSHAERVVEYLEKNGYGDEVIIVGYLHDILDNGGFCQSDLSMFFPQEVCEAVSHLSHNKTSCREEYLTKIMENKIATIVKIGDLTDNMIITKKEYPTDREYWKTCKYNREIERLTDRLHEFDDAPEQAE
jgi:(p)ppGpp synthase/HD superfamily hydrolase